MKGPRRCFFLQPSFRFPSKVVLPSPAALLLLLRCPPRTTLLPCTPRKFPHAVPQNMAPKNARSAPAARSSRHKRRRLRRLLLRKGGALVFDDDDEPSSTFFPNELPFNARLLTAHVRSNETKKSPNPERRSRSANHKKRRPVLEPEPPMSFQRWG